MRYIISIIYGVYNSIRKNEWSKMIITIEKRRKRRRCTRLWKAFHFFPLPKVMKCWNLREKRICNVTLYSFVITIIIDFNPMQVRTGIANGASFW